MQIILLGLSSGCIYAIAAIGFALVFATTRIVNVAHGAIFTIGGYVGFFFVSQDANTWLTAIPVVLMSGILGLVITRWLLQPLLRIPRGEEAALVTSLALYIVISNAIAAYAGSETILLRTEVESTISVMSVSLTSVQMSAIFLGFLTILLAHIMRAKTDFGLCWLAVGSNSDLAGIHGINTRVVSLVSFAAGSGLAGFAGYIRALDVGMTPHVGIHAFLVCIVASLLSERGRLVTPALWAVSFGILEKVAIYVIGAQWGAAMTLAVLMSLILFNADSITDSISLKVRN